MCGKKGERESRGESGAFVQQARKPLGTLHYTHHGWAWRAASRPQALHHYAPLLHYSPVKKTAGGSNMQNAKLLRTLRKLQELGHDDSPWATHVHQRNHFRMPRTTTHLSLSLQLLGEGRSSRLETCGNELAVHHALGNHWQPQRLHLLDHALHNG